MCIIRDQGAGYDTGNGLPVGLHVILIIVARGSQALQLATRPNMPPAVLYCAYMLRYPTVQGPSFATMPNPTHYRGRGDISLLL